LAHFVNLLDDISKRGAEIRARLRELLLRHEYPGDVKTRVLSAYVDVALEYHVAIWLLEKSELTGSAFAMVRTIFDSLFRALWINKVATEGQIEQASRDELKFPQMDKLREDIKENYREPSEPNQPELLDRLLDRLKEVWRVQCSYTHSGGRQLERRFTFDEMKPRYSKGEITEALNLANIALMLLLGIFFESMRCNEEADKTGTMLMQYFTDFAGRLQGRNSGLQAPRTAFLGVILLL
jgi:hypothetical protein